MNAVAWRWLIAAFLLFWGTVAGVFLSDYAVGEKGSGGSSPLMEIFLGIPLYLGLICSGCLLAIAIWKTCRRCKTIYGRALAILSGLLFAAANLVAYFVVALWFVIDVMEWDSL